MQSTLSFIFNQLCYNPPTTSLKPYNAIEIILLARIILFNIATLPLIYGVIFYLFLNAIVQRIEHTQNSSKSDIINQHQVQAQAIEINILVFITVGSLLPLHGQCIQLMSLLQCSDQFRRIENSYIVEEGIFH